MVVDFKAGVLLGNTKIWECESLRWWKMRASDVHFIFRGKLLNFWSNVKIMGF